MHDVEIHATPWKGREAAALGENVTYLIDAVYVNGQRVPGRWPRATIDLDGFMALAIDLTEPDEDYATGEGEPPLAEHLLADLREQNATYMQDLREWAAQFKPEDRLDGSTDEELLLPVKTFEFVVSDRSLIPA